MAKKILIISSSPRKGGNSDLLCDQFLKGAAEAGHYVEKFFVQDKKINFAGHVTPARKTAVNVSLKTICRNCSTKLKDQMFLYWELRFIFITWMPS